MKVSYNINYTREKLRNAVYTLATEPGDVRSRLVEAFSRCCILSEDNFPNELRDDWNWIVKQMNKYGPRKDGNGKIITDAMDNTMRKIKNSTGVKIAKAIYELKCKVEDYITEQKKELQ